MFRVLLDFIWIHDMVLTEKLEIPDEFYQALLKYSDSLQVSKRFFAAANSPVILGDSFRENIFSERIVRDSKPSAHTLRLVFGLFF